jgi:galactose-1-phosphate uridylyltransferase
MAIEFKKEIEFCKLLDPTNRFKEKTFPLEFRIDPLTKDVGIVVEFRWRQSEKPDLSESIVKSLERGCPFCPDVVEKVTPKFVPEFSTEGRIKFGKAIVFPNLMPYMPHSALTVFSSEHFVGLPEFTADMLIDAFVASQTYFKRVREYNSKVKYYLINWNYMPPANSSQIHPHLQLLAGYFPLPYYRTLLETSKKYHDENGTNYWSEFIVEEKKLQERYIATVGNTVWLTSFIPRSIQLDILAIFQGRGSFLSIPQEDIESFCQGLTKIFKYMDDQNFYSFDLCLYSGMVEEDSFWTQVRLIQRGPLPPDICDVGNLALLLDTKPCLRRPEKTCKELKRYFSCS